jgi:hypothetical protein
MTKAAIKERQEKEMKKSLNIFAQELRDAIKTAKGMSDPQGYWTYKFDEDGFPVAGYASNFVEASTLRGDQLADAVSLEAYKGLLHDIESIIGHSI